MITALVVLGVLVFIAGFLSGDLWATRKRFRPRPPGRHR